MVQRFFCFVFLTGLIFISSIRFAYGAEESIAYDQGPSVQPGVMLWAWDRPEDLRFIDPHEIGVAFLARTLQIKGEKVYVRPRLQPLDIPQGTYLIAVVRLQISRKERPQFSPSLRSKVASAIGEMKNIKGISAVQIDFDAKASERAFYKDMIRDLREQLPDTIALSITALASWCIHDPWLLGLPIDEAIPMLFRMGPERDWVSLYLEEGRHFKPLCNKSVGISTDEEPPKIPRERRLYLFNPKPWSEEAFRKVIREVRP